MVVTHTASACAEGARRRYERLAQTSSNSNLTLEWTRTLRMEPSGMRRSASVRETSRAPAHVPARVTDASRPREMCAGDRRRSRGMCGRSREVCAKVRGRRARDVRQIASVRGGAGGGRGRRRHEAELVVAQVEEAAVVREGEPRRTLLPEVAGQAHPVDLRRAAVGERGGGAPVGGGGGSGGGRGGGGCCPGECASTGSGAGSRWRSCGRGHGGGLG
mmetsp:Transcript_13838/g.40625  ORF Transcript_13838/g.40625 Transcript_13838/m.40625 type:complete len:218 (-) Transcript_13838:609-1262(-)